MRFEVVRLQYQDGLSLHLCALKTRKRRFRTICSRRSLALSTVATWLPRQPVCWACHQIHEYWQKRSCCLQSGPVETRPTVLVAMALNEGCMYTWQNGNAICLES